MTTFCQVETLLQSLGPASPRDSSPMVRNLRVCDVIALRGRSDVNISFTTENPRLPTFPRLTEVKELEVGTMVLHFASEVTVSALVH